MKHEDMKIDMSIWISGRLVSSCAMNGMQGRARCHEKKGISDARLFINSRNFLSYQLVHFSILRAAAPKKSC